jgi:acetolactate synthase-1/2/3 large subunit
MQLLLQAQRPMIYTGGGVILANAAPELNRLVDLLGYPCTNTLMGLGGYRASDPKFVGMLGMHGTYEANMAMQHCDVLIAVGARFDDRVIGNPKHFAQNPRKIIHVDVDPSSISKRVKVDVPIVGDVRETLLDLIALIEPQVSAGDGPDKAALSAWWAQIEQWRSRDCLSYDRSSDVIKPQFVVEKLWEVTGGDAFITSDVGQHQMWAAQFLHTGPRRWISSAGLGTMGYGMPAAMGVQTAFPDQQVICVAGDASILMNIQELGTLSQYNLPVKVVVLNNGWQGMVRQWQESFYSERYSASEMTGGMPDFPALAEAFGVKGVRISERASLRQQLSDALQHDGPAFIEVVVRRNENCYPMVPPGASNAQMVGLPSHPELAIDTSRECHNCHHTTDSSSLYCPHCGTKL